MGTNSIRNLLMDKAPRDFACDEEESSSKAPGESGDLECGVIQSIVRTESMNGADTSAYCVYLVFRLDGIICIFHRWACNI